MDIKENNALFMNGGIDDAFVVPALKFDFIYQYMTNVDWKYLAQIPSYKQPAYQLKRLWLCAANGYVPEWHYNFIPTKLGNSILAAINRKVFSGQMLFELSEDNFDASIDDKRKWLIGTYLDEINTQYEAQLEKLNLNAMGSGSSAFVAKINKRGELFFEAYREDKYLPTFVGNELESVRLFATLYNSVDGKSVYSGDASAKNYILEDYRYFGDDGEAYSVLRVFEQNGDVNSVVDSGLGALTYEDLPEAVAKAVYMKVGKRLNVPIKLPFNRSLGVKLHNNTKSSAYFDLPGYSDSILAPVIEQLFEYDRSYTTMVNDIALGRGQVLVPDSMDLGLAQAQGLTRDQATLAAVISRQNLLNSKIIRKIPVSNPEDMKPEAVQFDMRIQQHLDSLKGQRINILNGIGVNPGSIDPTIDESGHAKTATEVIADEQNLITFVENVRKDLVKISNWAIGLVMFYYFGLKDKRIRTKFTTGNLQNALLISQMVTEEYRAGLRSKESAVSKVNANDSKGDIDKELNKIKEEKSAEPPVQSPFGLGDEY